LIVVVVEVTRKAFLASLVPVIVDAILNEHQVVADIVAFVSTGDFPRSRLGEKQRGKVLASWVTRKLRTIAQFSIRDMEDNPFADMPQHRASRSSKPGSTMGNSMRRSTMNPDSDIPAVPQSPAIMVPDQGLDVAPEGYQDHQDHQDHMSPRHALPELDTRTDSHVSAAPVSSATSTVPYIQEPLSATIHSADDDHHFDLVEPEDVPPAASGEPGPTRDFRFSFDIINNPVESSSSFPSGTEQLSTGRDSVPSQQPETYGQSSGPAHDEYRPGTQESGLSGDWAQEALMYQSALGGEDGQEAHRTPSAGAQNRYDGTGYGF
jgi:hypothetical protein